MKKQSKTIPKGWQVKKIGDVLNYERPDAYIVKSTHYADNYKIPVLTANKSFILGYTNEDFGVCKNIPAIIFDDFTTDCKYVDFPFKVKSSAIKILRSRDDASSLKFVYELMKSINFPIANHKRHYISQYQNQQIIIPLIPEQEKIAEILGTVDEEIQKTDEIISQTEKLKKGLLQEFFAKSKSTRKQIGEVAEVFTGGTPRTSVKEYWNGTIKWMSSGEVNLRRVKDTEKTITKKGMENSNARIFPIGTVMIALAGQGKTRGKVAILDIETTCNQSLAGIITNNNLLSNEFLFYNLEYRYQELRNLSGGEGRSGLNLRLVKNFLIPVPDINEQKNFVEVLLAVDEKNSMNSKIKKKLTQLKKGLMQDLLSGEVRV